MSILNPTYTCTLYTVQCGYVPMYNSHIYNIHLCAGTSKMYLCTTHTYTSMCVCASIQTGGEHIQNTRHARLKEEMESDAPAQLGRVAPTQRVLYIQFN